MVRHELQLQWLIRACAVALGILILQSATAAGQTLCPANGNDTQPDDEAIQACLDAGGVIVLDADVQNGYYIAQGLRIWRSGTHLTSTSNFGYLALVQATSTLAANILVGESSASTYQISNIWLYGHKWNRNPVPNCADQGSNATLRGTFVVDNVVSQVALCGSGMQVEGTGFVIRNSQFLYNGFPAPSGPWADGLTVWDCDGGQVSNNYFEDNTDIDLIVGGGRNNCRVEDNNIHHYSDYGYAGLMIARFAPSYGDHVGVTYSGNTVTVHDVDRLSYGIMVGEHPWDWRNTIPHGGSVQNNTATGAVANLVIDGISEGNIGTISPNNLSGSQGTRGYPTNCSSTDYSVVHFGNAVRQPGAICRQYDSDASCVDIPGTCPAVR